MPTAVDALIVPPLKAANPPAELSPAVTFPAAPEPLMVPLLKPTKPPAALLAPALTLPPATPPLICPAGVVQSDEAAERAGLEDVGAVAAGDIAGRDIEPLISSEIESDESAGAAAGGVRDGHVAGRAGDW